MKNIAMMLVTFLVVVCCLGIIVMAIGVGIICSFEWGIYFACFWYGVGLISFLLLRGEARKATKSPKWLERELVCFTVLFCGPLYFLSKLPTPEYGYTETGKFWE